MNCHSNETTWLFRQNALWSTLLHAYIWYKNDSRPHKVQCDFRKKKIQKYMVSITIYNVCVQAIRTARANSMCNELCDHALTKGETNKAVEASVCIRMLYDVIQRKEDVRLARTYRFRRGSSSLSTSEFWENQYVTHNDRCLCFPHAL